MPWGCLYRGIYNKEKPLYNFSYTSGWNLIQVTFFVIRIFTQGCSYIQLVYSKWSRCKNRNVFSKGALSECIHVHFPQDGEFLRSTARAIPEMKDTGKNGRETVEETAGKMQHGGCAVAGHDKNTTAQGDPTVVVCGGGVRSGGRGRTGNPTTCLLPLYRLGSFVVSVRKWGNLK